MGPEHPTDDSMVGVSYIEFEQLEEPSPQQYDVASLVALAESEDWKLHYECLNILRAINRHNREYLLGSPASAAGESILSRIAAPFVRDQIDNLRSNLSKCALMLVKELF